MNELEDIKSFLRKLTGEPDKDLDVLDKLCSLKKYHKNDFFLEPKTIAVYSGFIVNGIFREFYIDANDREFNKAFCFKGDITGSYYDLHMGAPSGVGIQALTDSTVLVIRQTDFTVLSRADPFWLKVNYEIAHRLLMKKFEKEAQLLVLSAAERYHLLQQRHPDLEQLIPAYHIASYLGITAESLSRIRARKGN